MGQRQVQESLEAALSPQESQRAWESLNSFLQSVLALSHRPLVRQTVSCACVGADEAVLLTLVRTASVGMLNDAALIATLLMGPCHAERMALWAAELGDVMRRTATPDPYGLTKGWGKGMSLH